MENFKYEQAFARNLGWISVNEQNILKNKVVCIAGVGGVGGQYAEVLARLGVCRFRLADFDVFEIQNFNRQNGSGVSTLGLKKIEVIRNLIIDINPLAQIELFEEGLNNENISKFLDGATVYLDGLDFFVLDIRQLIFNECRKNNVTAITIAPVGMGASAIIFNSESMSFEDYFGLNRSHSVEEKAVRFLVGLTPSLIQAKYLVDRSKSNFKERKAPSLSIGPYLCAGIMGAQVLKILLNRKNLKTAPWSLHFDSYLNVYKKKYVFWGYRNPLQILKFYLLKKMLGVK